MFRVPLVALALLLSPITLPAYAGDDLKSQIQTLEDGWAAAYNANDAAGVAAFYLDDASLIPPGMDPIHGPEAIEQVFAGMMASLKDLTLVTDSVQPIGDSLAVEIGHADYITVGEDGSETPTTDYYVNIWKKDAEGNWKYAVDWFHPKAAEE